MIRLTEDETTDGMVMWLEDMAMMAHPFDAENLRACAVRMRQLDRDARDNMREVTTALPTESHTLSDGSVVTISPIPERAVEAAGA